MSNKGISALWIFALLALGFAEPGFGSECAKFQIENAGAESLCLDTSTLRAASANCVGEKASCGILKIARAYHEANGAENLEPHEIGSPGFQACRRIGARPEVINIVTKSEKIKISRCVSDKDHSSIDNNTLLDLLAK